MKPITTTNLEGRALLALRAGPMTTSELNERLGYSLPGWLLKAGYVVFADSAYRLTEAGRAACPYRNPLAAPGVVKPYTFKSEIEMSRDNVITRQQVLAAIVEAGAAGINKRHLVDRFPMVNENAITSHLVMLKKDGSINNPSLGLWVAVTSQPTQQSGNADARRAGFSKAPAPEAPAITPSPDSPFKAALTSPSAIVSPMIDELAELIVEASHQEPIDVPAIPERRATPRIDIDTADDFEVGIYSDGTLTLEIDDGLQDAIVEFSPLALAKLRRFLGLFAEVA